MNNIESDDDVCIKSAVCIVYEPLLMGTNRPVAPSCDWSPKATESER